MTMVVNGQEKAVYCDNSLCHSTTQRHLGNGNSENSDRDRPAFFNKQHHRDVDTLQQD
jgi:hypothetical protein